MAKKNWVWEGESEFIVRLYIKKSKHNHRSICMKVLKMPMELMGKDLLVSVRLSTTHQKTIVSSKNYRPCVGEGYLNLPKEESEVGVATWSGMWSHEKDEEILERHTRAIEALGGIIVGEGSELTDNKKKADTQEARRTQRAFKRAVPKPKDENIFGRNLVKTRVAGEEEVKDA